MLICRQEKLHSPYCFYLQVCTVIKYVGLFCALKKYGTNDIAAIVSDYLVQ